MSSSDESSSTQSDTSANCKESAHAGDVDSVKLTIDELIRSELSGKTIALGRYDAILWKIRAGYVAIIYGAGILLAGKDGKGGLGASLEPKERLTWLLIVVAVLSVSIVLVDWSFLISKIKVVVARNRLSDLALRKASGEQLTAAEISEISRLIHISGEDPGLPSTGQVVSQAWPLVIIYLAPLFALYLIVRLGSA